MTVCNDCSIDFYYLKEATLCHKCRELSGASPVERLAIKAKGQCMACSLVYQNLDDPLCRACCVALGKHDNVPDVLRYVDGAVKQLTRFRPAEESASDLLSSAAVYQSKASNSRLNKSISTESGPTKKVQSRFGKPLTPAQVTAQSVREEMKAAKEKATKIQIIASVWLTKHNKTGNMVMDGTNLFSASVGEEQLVFDAIGEVIKDAQDFHKKSHPTARRLTRQDITIYADQPPQKYYRLPDRLLDDKKTMRSLLDKFYENKWISRTQWEKHELQIQLVANDRTLFPTLIEDAYGPSSQRRTSTQESARLTRSRQSVVASSEGKPSAVSKRKLSAASSVNNGDAEFTKKMIRASSSGWMRKAQYSHDVVVIACQFFRTVAELDDSKSGVVFKTSDTVKIVHIAGDWETGMNASLGQKEYDNSGFIGMGTSKIVIYARIDGNEYVLGQFKDGNTSDENLRNLRGEFENLVYGEMFRASFEEIARHSKVPLPEFRFNLKGAMLGRFHGRPPCGLSFNDFIATPLLPCSMVDKPIEKFTGHADCGPPPLPNDAMTAVLHAFTHYMILHTAGRLVLCDLQETISYERLYWDNGPRAIDRILKQHLEFCEDNVICTQLGLRLIDISETDPQSSLLSSPFRGHTFGDRSSSRVAVKDKPHSDDDDENNWSLPLYKSKDIIIIDSDSDEPAKPQSTHREHDGRLRVGFPG
ncbi:hypothetical protein H0H92_003823 [Tricholoma furcatifolium]|nr:hypothetical protein H0H92_003823 [Tricholoma furcatifolium]